MDKHFKGELDRLQGELRALQERAEAVEGSFFLECTVDPKERDAYIEADTAGLLYFASRLVYLATKDVRGAHEHFDTWTETGERGSDPLIVSKWFPE